MTNLDTRSTRGIAPCPNVRNRESTQPVASSVLPRIVLRISRLGSDTYSHHADERTLVAAIARRSR